MIFGKDKVALATFLAACERWPGIPITLRQGARVMQPPPACGVGRSNLVSFLLPFALGGW
jgi:hypothetical protein